MTRGIHWFRNDLRIHDNRALSCLLEKVEEWLPLFIFDPRLEYLVGHPRYQFMLSCLSSLEKSFRDRGLPFLIRTGLPEEVLPKLINDTRASLISFNKDITPFAMKRDKDIRLRLEKCGIKIMACVDNVVFPASDIRTGSGNAYKIYTPYRNRWLEKWKTDPQSPISPTCLRRAIPGFFSETLERPHTVGVNSENTPDRKSVV